MQISKDVQQQNISCNEESENFILKKGIRRFNEKYQNQQQQLIQANIKRQQVTERAQQMQQELTYCRQKVVENDQKARNYDSLMVAYQK